jgi:hypothetical protein
VSRREKLWVVFAKDYDGVIIYLKVVKRKSTAKRYLKECQQFFGEKCQMKLGEFYTLDEADAKFNATGCDPSAP